MEAPPQLADVNGTKSSKVLGASIAWGRVETSFRFAESFGVAERLWSLALWLRRKGSGEIAVRVATLGRTPMS